MATAVTQRLEQINELVKANPDCDASGLAVFFADTNDLGSVLREDFTQFIDFGASFGRAAKDIFPRTCNHTLNFTTSKRTGDSIDGITEFADITVDLLNLKITKKVIWRGNRVELKLNSDSPNAG